MKVFLSFSAAVLLSLSSTAGNATPEWNGIGHYGSYADDFSSCSDGSTPIAKKCSDSRIGNIAICFSDRDNSQPADECIESKHWCGYKSGVNLSKVTTEGELGTVYFCAN